MAKILEIKKRIKMAEEDKKQQTKEEKGKTERKEKKTEEEKKIAETQKEKSKEKTKEKSEKEEEKEDRKEDKAEKTEKKEPVKKEAGKKTEKKKRTEAVVRASNLPISTKQSAAICRFIRNKNIGEAIADLEKVARVKKAVPMKGEIPHRRAMMSGAFPKKASRHFIVLLKSLAANANVNELEEPIISEATANIGSRPFGRFGAVRKKRTHIIIKAREVKAKAKEKQTKQDKKEEKK